MDDVPGKKGNDVSTYVVSAGIIFCIAAVLSLDAYLYWDKIKGNTYSEIIRGWFRDMPVLFYMVAFVMGLLMAHWGQK